MRGSSRDAGYTLLEVIVALGLLGLTLTLVAANGVQMLERWRENLAFREIQRQVRQLRFDAFYERRTIAWNLEDAAPLPLPTGWNAKSLGELRFLPSGVCVGGNFQIVAPSGRTQVFRLVPPNCDVVDSASRP